MAALSAVVVAGVVVVGGSSGTSPPSNPLGSVEAWEQYAEAGHRLGPKDAAVTIVEFGDYQCPFCRSAASQLEAILTEYSGEVTLVYRHLPLAVHDQAYAAARAAECAGHQGKFWQLHNLLYSDGSWMTGDPLAGFVALAEQAGVPNTERFQVCVSDEKIVPAVEADKLAAAQVGFTGTPSFLVNGQRHRGASVLDPGTFRRLYESLKDAR